jgi:hypothetical protein
LRVGNAILLIMKDLGATTFFAYCKLLCYKALKIKKFMVEAAGVEPVICTENTQVTETENA